MDIYTLISLVITLAALIGYINHRYVHMQTTIAIMAGAMMLSIIILVLQHLGFTELTGRTRLLISQTNFHDLLLKGMLSFLLFAGALTIDLRALKTQLWEIGILATVSTIASTLLIGFLSYYLLPLINIQINRCTEKTRSLCRWRIVI
jgi:CPA1 family monovalent cation:H+ antiporter